jgi:hypothetical protein
VYGISDSSSKEEEYDSSSTTSSMNTNNTKSVILDDCDWDYFEPGATGPSKVQLTRSPFGSPSFYRKDLRYLF